MLETALYESERRLPASAVVALGLSAFAAMVILVAPGLLGEVDFAALTEQLPRQYVETFDLERIGTMEGFIAIELYQFVWLLGLGVYVAYSAAGSVTGDVEDDRMDLLLAAPVSRGQVVAEKFLALLVPVLVVNVAVLVVVYAGTRLVGEPVAAVDLVAVHVLSIPYLLCCGAFGMLASVAAPDRLVAEGVATGALIGAFLVETVTAGTDVAWLGAVAPTRYYDPLEVLTASEYDLAGAGLLLAAAFVILLGSGAWFRAVDVR